jgi:hypothetical protein
MFERIISVALLISFLFGDVARAMEPEERENPSSQQRVPERPNEGQKNEDNLPIKTRYLMANNERTKSITSILDLFYDKCVNQLVVFADPSQKADPNCGLPKKVAQPFLELCRQFTRGLVKKEDKVFLIKSIASLDKTQVNFLTEKEDGSNNRYLTMWHCLISETTPAKIRKNLIPLLLQIQDPKIEVLLRLNALLQEEDMNGNQLIQLIEFIINLPEESHFFSQKNYARVFKKHPNMSFEGKMKFLQQLSMTQAEGLENLLKQGEEGAFNDTIIFDGEEFTWTKSAEKSNEKQK